MPNPLFDALLGPHLDRERVCITTPDGQNLSFRDVITQTARIANSLCALGLGKEDVLAVQVEKSPTALCIYLACLQTGIVFLPLNTGYTAAELRYFITDSAAKLLICDKDKYACLVDNLPDIAMLTLNDDGTGTLADHAQKQPGHFSTVACCADDLAALLYTSGTTGRSKGAMLTQGNLLSNAQTLVDLWQFDHHDRLIHALPIYHTHGLFVAMNVALISGAEVYLMPAFDAGLVIEQMPKATALMGVPTFYTRLLDSPAFNRSVTENMRLFVSGSAPLLQDTHEKFEAISGHRILERYGMTETGMSISNPYSGARRAGTVGLALPDVDIRIVDESKGTAVVRGEIGMLEVRGENVFQGYLNMPEKTAEAFRADGFFITGDLARQDDQGYVHIVGREKDLIISGGLNIYPKEIEQVLDAQFGVLESAVIGVPHPDFGETPVGILVARPRAKLDIVSIQTGLAGQLARFKQPRQLIVVDILPRNTMGKVQKNLLRKQYTNLFA
ncbi:malonyl-CoA synthase [Amylibacter marinus]|uniref:Malonyl-CoA synthase n=1 Tax=Amylibacter marinus TaxID=1475483 RepID=A0ABQ5VQN9_9RHOB|nr:malonyl-CoA synthase [Amylibacter marinus]GLQ33728.1 malonyl-CoA synthase [Amylibacter marinus]